MKAHRAKDRLGLTPADILGPSRLITDYSSEVCVLPPPKQNPKHILTGVVLLFRVPVFSSPIPLLARETNIPGPVAREEFTIHECARKLSELPFDMMMTTTPFPHSPPLLRWLTGCHAPRAPCCRRDREPTDHRHRRCRDPRQPRHPDGPLMDGPPKRRLPQPPADGVPGSVSDGHSLAGAFCHTTDRSRALHISCTMVKSWYLVYPPLFARTISARRRTRQRCAITFEAY